MEIMLATNKHKNINYRGGKQEAKTNQIEEKTNRISCLPDNRSIHHETKYAMTCTKGRKPQE